MTLTYRGFEIEKQDGSKPWKVFKDKIKIYACDTEDQAYLFIDGEKAIEHKKK